MAPRSAVQTSNLCDLKMILHYLCNTKSYRKYSSIFNMKYNASVGTNTNIHIRTVPVMAFLSFYYAESNTVHLQHIPCFKAMCGKLAQGYTV